MRIRETKDLVEDKYYLLVLQNGDLHSGTCRHYKSLGFYFQPKIGSGSPVITEDDIKKSYLVLKEG